MALIDETSRKKYTMGLFFVALTILLTVYGQIVIKWQVEQLGTLPPGIIDKVIFALRQYLNPWVISGLGAAFVASMCWILAMTQLELSFAYPFMGLTYVFIMILSAVFFDEVLTLNKIAGTVVVVLGIAISSQ